MQSKIRGTGMHGGVIYERGDILEPVKGTKTLKLENATCKVIEALSQRILQPLRRRPQSKS